MNFKPKSLKVYVPGHGVVDKADFNETHLKACLKQIEAAGLDRDDYLKKRFEIASYGDMPLFAEESNDAKASKKSEAERLKKEEADRIAQEDADRVARERHEKAEADRLEKERKEKADADELERLLAEEAAAKKQNETNSESKGE